MKTKLYGIGVGPGDPELLTLKAKRIMNSVDILICPTKKLNVESFAYEIVKENLEDQVHVEKLVYPMHYDTNMLINYWQENGEKINRWLEAGKTCAFITLGDPTVYSTFMYTLPYIDAKLMDLEIVPGITSFCAVASEIKQPLMLWEEGLKILPVRKNDSKTLMDAIENHENIVLMKPSNNPEAIIQALKAHHLEDKFMLISKVGTDENHFIKDIDILENTKLPYLSTMIIKKGGFYA